jgi:hypothetical protein
MEEYRINKLKEILNCYLEFKIMNEAIAKMMILNLD